MTTGVNTVWEVVSNLSCISLNVSMTQNSYRKIMSVQDVQKREQMSVLLETACILWERKGSALQHNFWGSAVSGGGRHDTSWHWRSSGNVMQNSSKISLSKKCRILIPYAEVENPWYERRRLQRMRWRRQTEDRHARAERPRTWILSE